MTHGYGGPREMKMRRGVRESPSQKDYMERVRAEGHFFISRLHPTKLREWNFIRNGNPNLILCSGLKCFL